MDPAPTTVLGIATDVWGAFFRHMLQTAAGALAAHGVIASATVSDATLQIGTAVCLGALSFAWSWYQKYTQRKPCPS